MLDLQGVFVPVPSPFTDDGSQLSEIRLARFLRRLLDGGADGLVVGGEASEYFALSFSERKQLLELVSRCVPPGTPVLANVATNSTAASIDLAQHAGQCGARAALLTPPSGMHFSDIEISDHIHRISQYGRLPVIVVDPTGRLDSDFRCAIEQTPGVSVANPLRETPWVGAACFERSTLDEFALGQIAAIPLALFGIDWKKASQNEAFDALRELVRIFGPARVLKSTVEDSGVELGPLRGPLQPLPRPAVEALHRLFQMAA